MAITEISGGFSKSRRNFLKLEYLRRPVSEAAGIGIMLTTIPLFLDHLHLPYKLGVSLTADGKSLILGNHALGDDDTRIVNKFNQTGDLSLSRWPTNTQDVIDQSMRNAAREGRPYVLALDSVDSSGFIPGNDPKNGKTDGWTWLPFGRMNLKDRNAYPNDIFLIGADIPYDFNLTNFFSDENDVEHQNTIKQLSNDLAGKYNMVSPQAKANYLRNGISVVSTDILDFIFIASGLAAGMNLVDSKKLVKRRNFLLKSLGIAALTDTAWKVAGFSYGIADTIGNPPDGISNEWWQNVLTWVANTSNQTQGDPNIDLWLEARTALATEKTQAYPQADLLYGSAHNMNALPIMNDSVYRREKIRAFSASLFATIDDAIKHRYQNLLPYRNRILERVGNSLQSYMEMPIQDAIPWGKTIDKDYFGNKFYSNSQTRDCPVIQNIVNEELLKLDVPLGTLSY